MANLTSFSRCILLFFLLLWIGLTSNALPETVKIGLVEKTWGRIVSIGLFDEGTSPEVFDAFRSAVQAVNDGRRGASLAKSKLIPRTIQNFRADLVTGPLQICGLLKEEAVAIFGPQRTLSTALTRAVANATQIVHLSTRWTAKKPAQDMSVSIYPDHEKVVAKALTDLVRHFNWTSFALIYDDAESLIRASGLLDGTSGLKPTLYKLNERNMVSTLQDVKASGVSFLVLDCPGPRSLQILRAAMSLDMVNFYFHYVLTTWDIHLLDLSEIYPTHVNLTALQLVDFFDQHVQKAIKGWKPVEPGTEERRSGPTTVAALLHDAVYLFSKALRKADEELTITPTSVDCDALRPWSQGPALRQRVLKTKLKGLTGDISFDGEGRRTHAKFNIMEPLRDGLHRVGTWTSDKGIQIHFDYAGHREFVQSSIKNKTLRVLTKLEAPYVMEKHNISLYSGNDRYRGFCVDILNDISHSLNFTYELVATSLMYGDQDPVTKEWGGLVRELIDKKGDMVLGAITITTEREEVVDFSQPFMYLGVRILLKKPEKKPTALFSFLDPLSVDVWIYIVIAYLGTSCVMFVIGRFSPYEWFNPNPCVEEAGVVENQFSIFNAMWFAIGSLMQEGTEIAPRAMSTRFLAGIWWFFTMIMVGSYTANLAAFLTAERMKLPIENAHDLVKQNQIKYGCLEGGATCGFFKNSVYPDYERMWDAIKSDAKNNIVQSHAEGIAKVKASTDKEGYAYLMESSSLDYITSRDCNLTGIGNPLDTKGFGLAFPKNSPFREEISVAILTQQDKGYLEELRVRWWKQEDGGDTCHDVLQESGTSAMGLDMVGGVFAVVLIGIVLGIAVALFEFIWKAKKNPDEYKDSIAKEAVKAVTDAVRSPHARNKAVVRPATPNQLREEVLSAAVPMQMSRRRYGIADDGTPYHFQDDYGH